MALQNVHSKEMRLVLSSDAKPRLKWTPELHQRFVDAVDQLGGAEKATPKSLMRVMGIHGLTLYHLKSHLQAILNIGWEGVNNRKPTTKISKKTMEKNRGVTVTSPARTVMEQKSRLMSLCFIRSLQITRALEMQMEVQRKLHEQIEVQRHLQLRIEAQGKYLQSVLRKAQETLSEYGSCSIEVEHAKAQLSELVSMVDSGCPSSSFSVLTQSEGSMLKDERNKLLGHNGCSLESSLTSSESSWRKEETQPNHEVDENHKHENGKMKKEERNSIVLPLMEMHPVEKGGSESQASERKRSRSAIDEIEESTSKRSGLQEVERFRLLENIDLNCKSLNDSDSSGPKAIDLNSNGIGNF
ncbi:hypothetical protein Pfo_009511 [Paulownia fortunei]|nr:hypothetical protein Pfo_009511 [Paulownia fortunei]